MSATALLFASKPLGLRCAQVIHDLAPETLPAVVTIDDAHDSRSALSAFRAWSERGGVALHVAANRDEAERLVDVYAPDLVLCISWYWFIRASVLRKPRRGFIGVHFSLLPRYRGGSPLVWAILNGERETGVSLFTLAEKMDEGDLWAQERLPIPPDAYVAEVLEDAEETTVRILRDCYRAILDGAIEPWPQRGEANVVPMRRPEDGRIDWSQPARRIFDFVRAQSRPYPGAFTIANGERVSIWRASIGPELGGDAGTIQNVDGRVAIVCGDGSALMLDETEPSFDGRFATLTRVGE